MKKSRFVSQEFIDAITNETSKLIAAADHVSVEEAIKLFKNSKVFEYLYTSPEPFYEEDPQYFYELFENCRKGKGLLDNTDLYLKKHPELYSMP